MIAKIPRIVRGHAFRLILTYTGIFVVSAALLLGLLWWFAVRQPLEQTRAQVQAEGLRLAAQYGAKGEGRETLILALAARAATASGRAAYHVLTDPNGNVSFANIPSPPPLPPHQRWGRFEFEFESEDQGLMREHEALAYEIRFADGARLLVGRDINDIDEIEDQVAQAWRWGLGWSLLIGLLGGGIVSAATGRRIDAIASAADQVMADDLSGRVPVTGADDDFDHLAKTLNAMLGRLQAGVQSIERLSDNIAHELRTPLTRLSADLVELEGDIDDPIRRTVLIQAARENAKHLQLTFDALLRIARVENGRHGLTLTKTDLAQVLKDVAESYSFAAQARSMHISISISDAPAVMVDPNLIYQALANLLENAIRYGAANGTIGLSLRLSGLWIVLAVENDGSNVAEQHLPHLSERFYRADHSSSDGLGLGLSLVSAIAGRHGGELVLRNRDGGFVAELRLLQQDAR
jgi:signal transduction histidine kinase